MNRRQKRLAIQAAKGHHTANDADSPAAQATQAFGLGMDAVAMDAFRNLAARMGYGTSSLPESSEYQLIRWSNDYWLMVTLYRNHWIVRRIIESFAQDMCREWCRLETTELDPEQISNFTRTLARTGTKMAIQKALKWAGLFGGAGCLIVIDGHEDILDQPLELDDVNPGTYRGLITFDRWAGIQPGPEICTDVARPNEFGLPEWYNVRGYDSTTQFRVHSSRILRFCGPDVPSPEFQASNRWGISRIEPVFEELRKRDNASWAILNLLFRSNVLAQTNPELAQLLSGAAIGGKGLEQFQQRMQAQNELLSNQSMLILGKDGKLESTQFSFSGLDGVLRTFQQDIVGASGSTTQRIFGKLVGGLGDSDEVEERVYEQRVAGCQDEEMRPNLESKLYPVMCMSEFGFVPDDLDLSFPSLRVLSEKEKSEMAKDGGELIITTFGAGLITEQEALQELSALSEQTGVFTNITRERIAAASNVAVKPVADEPDGGGDEGGGEE
jgi:phage-related protein (TIGR01555 family)